MGQRVFVLDTTLRDGAQSEGINFSLSDKLGTVMLLDNLGFSYIEAGIPASNPKDVEFFEKSKTMQLTNSKIVAFGLTRKKDETCEKDVALGALVAAGTEIVAVVGKCSAFQVKNVLMATREQNIEMIRDTVEYLVKKGKQVFFDAEHFFDGYEEDSAYALDCLSAAVEAGSETLVLCDTNGGKTPDEVKTIVGAVVKRFGTVRIGTHFHNDAGLAVANSLAAVEAGAYDVQGTFLGIGERCGNTNLSSLVPTLQTKFGLDVVSKQSLSLFTRTAYHLSEICNTVVPANAPYVGSSAFSHKGGMHIDGVVKTPKAFEHIAPEEVGNTRKILLSEVAGKSAVAAKLGKINPEFVKDESNVDKILARLKQLEYEGYQYESASASFELMSLREFSLMKDFFTLLSYKIIGERSLEAGRRSSLAVVKISVDGAVELCAAEGDGPVHALDISLRTALSKFYPSLSKTHLIDYKVRVISPEDATASKVRVLIDTTDGDAVFTTVGVSADIIDASFKAITDSVSYSLYKNKN